MVGMNRTKALESKVCSPDQFGRILNCDQKGRSSRQSSFRRPMGVRRVSVLSELNVGESGVLVALDLPESVQNHLMHMGFVPDALVTVITLRLTRDGKQTRVAVAYDRTALSADADSHVRHMAEGDKSSGPDWEKQVNEYLARSGVGSQ